MPKRTFKEWLSLQLAQKPSRVVLLAIFVFNLLFLLIAAWIISSLSLSGTEKMGFLQAAFCTITMILDPGCISYVVEDIGQTGVLITVICLIVVILGMIFFTGTVIGYVTNYISEFVSSKNTGQRKLDVSNHIVLLNWNSRASEIINDLLFCDDEQTVVVLVNGEKDEIEKEIRERLLDTEERNNRALYEKCESMGFFERRSFIRAHKLKQNVTFVVREGDVFSVKQLQDISLDQAKMAVILSENDSNEQLGKSLTIKTLMQVADIMGSEGSRDNQRIIVEITDEWTGDLVKKIVEAKSVRGKCAIIPLNVNKILGQLIAQFTVMPELNLVYRELFSNRGNTIYVSNSDHNRYVNDNFSMIKYIDSHKNSIPLTTMDVNGKKNLFYVADTEKEGNRVYSGGETQCIDMDLNEDYWIVDKNVVVLGHNSKIDDIIQGFCSFRDEWNYKDEREILKLVIIDDEESLAKRNYYQEVPFEIKTVAANIFDEELIVKTIEDFIDQSEEDTNILILSDDDSSDENVDAKAMAYLVYVQEIINRRKREMPDFDEYSIDVLVEIIDPKHNDIVKSYNINNVVISNRYISKMITQIGEREVLFDFYSDILTYSDTAAGKYISKEIYSKKVNRFFNTMPPKCKADVFIKSLYMATTDENITEEEQNSAIMLGYVKPGGKMFLFGGNQQEIEVEIEERDKLIVFSNH